MRPTDRGVRAAQALHLRGDPRTPPGACSLPHGMFPQKLPARQPLMDSGWGLACLLSALSSLFHAPPNRQEQWWGGQVSASCVCAAITMVTAEVAPSLCWQVKGGLLSVGVMEPPAAVGGGHHLSDQHTQPPEVCPLMGRHHWPHPVSLRPLTGPRSGLQGAWQGREGPGEGTRPQGGTPPLPTVQSVRTNGG